MPTFSTSRFGTIEYQDDSVIQFPFGLPGFEEERQFVAIEHTASRPIVFLQSLTRPDLCFITLPVLVVKRDYRLAISPADLKSLALPCDRQPEIGTDVLCLAIISVAEGRLPTANLLAPVVVNLKTRVALQAIQEESAYSHQYPLLDSRPEAECS
ncbi:MAG TPA: flagellar assembly protein FliW [Bryobacteraceae bacterium]|nr:flagellar assembly protein FliW [Bryobacteraceae bacterium]HOL69837.1 flagellar assembly protein FliW [Bryobacteraceae bacterium]HOQ45210.1 flagellar assembly protein FliW [Bryobacteraceae bacterium]HPQ14317.1 flagellar assembly protein FliW [Bryobacteraceae bacterium]HPU71282.1 flagellar assembly protein FliW [Bryobacteraceae bacterium]